MHECQPSLQEVHHTVVDIIRIVCNPLFRQLHPGKSQGIQAAGNVEHAANRGQLAKYLCVKLGKDSNAFPGRSVVGHHRGA